MAYANGDIIEISLRGVWVTQAYFNIWQYEINNVDGTIDSEEIGEAWWNHVKTVTRAMSPAAQLEAFQSVYFKTLMSATGDAGEYSIPSGERIGSRAAPAAPSPLPPSNAVGVKLSVGTRLTRPGQKRITYLTETDNDTGLLQSAFEALLVTMFNTYTALMTLGAPAATVELDPVVVSKGGTGLMVANQPITSYAINRNISTQVSRKIGRGI